MQTTMLRRFESSGKKYFRLKLVFCVILPALTTVALVSFKTPKKAQCLKEIIVEEKKDLLEIYPDENAYEGFTFGKDPDPDMPEGITKGIERRAGVRKDELAILVSGFL